MKRATTLALAACLAASCPACASLGGEGKPPVAPQPAKPIDPGRFFVGRWYEIARTPMKLTDGCVAGTTDYSRDANGAVIDRDACRTGTPQGKEKVFAGPITILNPDQNTKFIVHYKVFGPITASRTYWMLDHGDNYQWFIVSDPAFDNVSLFTRAAQPSPDMVKQLAARAQQLGYDVSKLEYPTQFPAGQGAPSNQTRL